MNALDAREWMLPLSMKASPNARGVAVLTVLIPMNFMQYLLEQTHRSGGDAVLMRADGTVLLRDPHGAAFVDKAIPQGAVLARWRDQEHGAYVVDRLADGTRRLNAFSNVPGLPIVVGHGIDLDQVLKPWQAAAQWHAAITIVVIALVWLLAGLMARAVRDDEAYKLKLLRAKERAEAASRAKSKFLAVTSHELRTPLNAIMGFSEMISLRIFGGDLDRYCRYAEDIHRSAAHLLSIIEEILDVSRLEAGKLDLHEEVIDLVEISTEIIELLQPQAANAGVALTAPTARGPVVHADAKAVRQMLLNLASNSLKFTNSGGRVEIGAGTASGRPFLRVADTGIGIKPEHQALVLEPFGQVADAMAREQGGLGLGLPIVKNLIQLHGGDMTLDSAPGRGTTITLVFPANRLLAEATSAPPRPERIMPTVIAAAA
ncbi:MAG: HAMP domain-containing histidine kinase [Proteobacteria bacterium]|nr:HAMP domain-containing histidine kinase [Pseudomonadota bacterium]